MLQTPEKELKRKLQCLELEGNSSSLSGTGILAAVSGGADSVALLCLLHRLSPCFGYNLSAITINHLLRTVEESSGDAQFVASLCLSLDPPVPCRVVNLLPGEVEREAAKRGRGIEEAARAIRYRYFEETALKSGASIVMTGHTATDQLETILMRFFQGSGGTALGGIAWRRGLFARPLLEIPRSSITDWLLAEGISWREDASNSDTSFLRNRIRQQLVPVLESILPGWDSGVLAASRKARLDEDLCRHMITVRWKRSGTRVECLAEDFANLHPALALRFLQTALNLLEVDHRVSFRFLQRLLCAPAQWKRDGLTRLRICGSGLCFALEDESVFFGPDIVQNGKSGYLVHVCACGTFSFPFGEITVSGEDKAVFLDGTFGPFSLPLTIRSRMAGDSISTADGKKKTLKKMMNGWSIPESDRNLLPLVEQAGNLCAVYGSVLGYPDWYVRM